MVVISPVSGEIIESNTSLVDTPDQVNGAPYESWLFKIKPAAGASLAAESRDGFILVPRLSTHEEL